MASMNELSNHIISIAKSSNLPITNLQVQKVMFFTLGMHIRQRGHIDELTALTYDIPFEKWQYGPVIESIYYRLNHFKDKPITLDGIYSQEYRQWDNMIQRLLQINVFDLVKISHDLPSWANYENAIINREFVESYSLDEIAEDFIE